MKRVISVFLISIVLALPTACSTSSNENNYVNSNNDTNISEFDSTLPSETETDLYEASKMVVSVDNDLAKRGIILSETPGFEYPSVTLDGGSVKDYYHFTYDWFESRGVLDELDNIDGSHNGKDYFAYTFYIQNNGTETFDYNATLEVTGVSKSCDEAARIMVYKNGEPTIYAKPKLGTTDDTEFVSHEKSDKATLFYDNDTVYTETLPDFSPGDVDKYSVVIWFEGEDSECINDIMGGHMRLSMNFEANCIL